RMNFLIKHTVMHQHSKSGNPFVAKHRMSDRTDVALRRLMHYFDVLSHGTGSHPS
ncbi:hypothetical protein L9F63_019609, partial [Diploptera punctata]